LENIGARKMKVTRKAKSAINRRANFVAAALRNAFSARMQAAAESGDIDDDGIEEWWPAEFDTTRDRDGQVMASPAGNAVDVCGACDAALPEGCGGQFRGDMSCERRKRGLVNLQGVGDAFADVSPPYRKPGKADPGFDATDHLAGF